MTLTTHPEQSIVGIPLPAFEQDGICDACEQPALVAEVIAQDGEPVTLCYHCWKSGKDFVSCETCGVCGEFRICLRTEDGWRCTDCLAAGLPIEMVAECARCGQLKVLRKTTSGWLCMRCQIFAASTPFTASTASTVEG
ncbi:MAG TPA: hypothetical protein VM487_03180 [Phycisphaerae bacterium]|nr:hypothetical protein [Phycisphaerae bacterium]